MRTVILFVGPPGSGKSTAAKQWAERNQLTHLEREQYPTDDAYRSAVVAHASQPDARLAVVRCCPTQAEQREWEALTGATETIVLDTPIDECVRRIAKRRRAGWRGELMAAKEWHERRIEAPATSSRRWL